MTWSDKEGECLSWQSIQWCINLVLPHKNTWNMLQLWQHKVRGVPGTPWAWKRPKSPWLFWVFALRSSGVAACDISEIVTKHLTSFSWERTNLWHFSCTTPTAAPLCLTSLRWRRVGKLTAPPPALRGKGVKCQYLGFLALCKAQAHRISLPPSYLSSYSSKCLSWNSSHQGKRELLFALPLIAGMY